MRSLAICAVAAGCVVSMAAAGQAPAVRITSPAADAVISGPSSLAATLEPETLLEAVQGVSFFVNGRLVCSVETPPFACPWDPGAAIRGHHVRVVVSLTGGRRLVGNVHTKNLGHTEQVRAEAILVPAIVTTRGQFVRGLKQQDFEVYEDGVRQPIASFVAEEAPLDLVLAVDISGSMEGALVDVKAAVRHLLARLRPGDAATILGFNDNTFVVAEREKDAATREAAVGLLTPWGGTALYDATVRALDLVGQQWGRKGVVLFSDGDDRHSLTTRETAMARVQASDAMLYTVGFGSGVTVPRLKSSLDEYARSTGGRAFYPRDARELDSAFDQIVEELASQYVLSYSPTNSVRDGKWRNITVQIRKGNYDVRARRGYRAEGPQQAGR